MPYATNDGVRIHWRARGAGEPLLLIMGLGYSLDMWHHVEARLAERFRIILFDNRGIGRSDPAPGPHLIPTMADDAAAVLDAAGIDTAFVFGISMGGFIAQEFALRHPDRVRALVLGCTACNGPHVVRAEQVVQDTLRERVKLPIEESVRVMVPYIYDPHTPRERIEADTAIRLANYPDPDTYLGQLAGIAQWQSCDRLEQLDLPTLILHGTSDRLVPPENAPLLAAHIRGAVLRLIPDASHIFFTDQPERTVELVNEFLEDTAAAATG